MQNETVENLLLEEELPQGALGRYLRSMGVVTKEQEEAWWAAYEKERQENPCVFSREFRLNDQATVAITRRLKEASPSVHICDMAPNGGSGFTSLEGARDFAAMFRRQDLFADIESAYHEAEVVNEDQF